MHFIGFKRRIVFALAFLVSSIAFFPRPSGAQDQFYCMGSGGSNLTRIDTSTGVGTIIGGTGMSCYGCGFAQNGNLYGIVGWTNSQLARIDINTGAATPLFAPLGAAIIALDSSPATGFMYGCGTDGAYGRVDLTTGVFTPISNIGGYLGDLAFTPTGDLYIMRFPGGTNSEILHVDPANGNIISSVAVNGALWAPHAFTIGNDGRAWLTENHPTPFLRLVDLTTGNTTQVGNGVGVGNIVGGDIRPASSEMVVPTAAFTIFRGGFVSGNVNSLRNSDDSYLVVRNGAIAFPLESPITVLFDATAPQQTASALKMQSEFHVSITGLGHRIDAFNYAINDYDNLLSGVAPTSDTVFTDPLSNPNDHIQSGTMAMRGRVRIKPTGPVFTNTWTISVDQWIWLLTP